MLKCYARDDVMHGIKAGGRISSIGGSCRGVARCGDQPRIEQTDGWRGRACIEALGANWERHFAVGRVPLRLPFARQNAFAGPKVLGTSRRHGGDRGDGLFQGVYAVAIQQMNGAAGG